MKAANVNDRYCAAFESLRAARTTVRALIKKAPTQNRMVSVVQEVVKVLKSWDEELADWPDATAVLAWRQRLRFDPGPKDSDIGALRVLVRYLTGFQAKRSSQVAALVEKLRTRDPSSIPALVAQAGGIDALSFRNGRLPQRKVVIKRVPKKRPRRANKTEPTVR